MGQKHPPKLHFQRKTFKLEPPNRLFPSQSSKYFLNFPDFCRFITPFLSTSLYIQSRAAAMGACCSRDKDKALLQDVFESSANFWKAPSYEDLWKQHRPVLQYSIRGIYRGERTVLTEREIKAACTILRAFRGWKERQNSEKVNLSLVLVTHL